MPYKDPKAKKAYGKRWSKDNRDARSASYKRWYQKNRKAQIARSRRRHLSQYGLSLAAYNQMIIDQAGLCFICEKQMRHQREPAVDHDHVTGFVRALLCNKCNLGLHWVEEHEGFFEKAKQYLEKFPRW